MSTENSNPNKLLPLAAGCIAGAIEATAVWPMEYVKTQLQLQVKSSKVPYTGMISGLSYTIKTTGFFSLYRGLAPTLIGSVPKAGVRFGLNAHFKDMLKDKDGKISIGSNFLAGLGAGISEALIIVAPVETIKTKCIELNQSFVTGLKHILQTEGIRGVYKGATATALKQGSNQGLRFMWFNEYKKVLTHDGERTLTPIEKFLGGMTAGCFSTLGNNPFDVIKTRMQGTKASQYSSTLDCLKKILSQEGFGALYAGVIPRLGRVVPGQGIIFFSFETIQDALKGYKIFQ
jgi:solute carrier family 25 citrate transporter 1